jgi:hypothetical protein
LAILLFRKEILKKRKFIFIAGAILIIFLTIALPFTFFQDSSARYRWTEITDEGAIARIAELRGASTMSPLFNRIVYNKITYFLPRALSNYLLHFNPDFLFFNGGSNYQYSVPGSGLIYIGILPFVLLGVLQTIKKKYNWQFFILGWLIIAPFPGAITRDAPHALRSLFLTIPLILLAVLGIDFIKKNLQLKLVKSILVSLVLILLANLYLFWQNYSDGYRKNYSWSWQYGYGQVMDYVEKYGEDYNKIVISKKYGEPHIFTLFYLKIDPKSYINDVNLVRYKKSDWWWVDRFDKFEFVNDWEIKGKTMEQNNTLLITSPGNYPEGSKLLKTINFLNGKPAFDIVKI